MRYVPRMWENLRGGNSFDVILVVATHSLQRERLRTHFQERSGWRNSFPGSPVDVASLDELGGPWRGGNFDASLFAVQRIRRLLRLRGVPEGKGRSLAVIVAGEGTRAYPLTAAEGGTKSMIRIPARLGERSLRLVELAIAQYHQILDDVEPGRIHIAAGDHVLAWERPPENPGKHHVQIFAHRVSFADEARAAGLLDSEGDPRWNGDGDLQRRLGALDVRAQLPVVSSLGQMGLLKTRLPDKDLLRLVEKPDPATVLTTFADTGGEALVNWWDWSLSPEAAKVLVGHYGNLVGSGIDLSMDVLEAVTMEIGDWRRRRPHRNPGLWSRANMAFENAVLAAARPLGPIGVSDPGEGSIFADVGTLQNLHGAFSSALRDTCEGECYRNLLGVDLENGVLFVGERPGPGVSIEPGAMVIDGSRIRSGSIRAGSIVVDTSAKELRTDGDCIVYGVRAPEDQIRVASGEVWADVVHCGFRHTVKASLLRPPRKEAGSETWYEPQHGNPMSFSDLHTELTRIHSGPGKLRADAREHGSGRRSMPAGRRARERVPWKSRSLNKKEPASP